MKKNKDLAKDGGKMSRDKFNSLRETDYLLSTKANAKNLEKSIKNAKKGKTRKFKINEI